MGAHEFSVPARDLDAGGKQVRFPVRAAWIRGALEGTEVAQGGSDGVLDVRLSKSETDVVVRGRLTAELTVPCARCLEPALVVVNEPVSALAVPAGELRPSKPGETDEKEEEDLPARDPEMIGYDGETLVLDDLVRDELLLAVTMIPLCSEGCPGIRPAISSISEEPAQSAVDPRLRPLLRLKKTPM
jgi:uncharacterized protein